MVVLAPVELVYLNPPTSLHKEPAHSNHINCEYSVEEQTVSDYKRNKYRYELPADVETLRERGD